MSKFRLVSPKRAKTSTRKIREKSKPRLKSDGLFKTVMANEIAAREFLEEYLAR